jgi:hypothetical protein
MVVIKSKVKKVPGHRDWYVKLIKDKEGYYVDYDTEDGAGESHHYALKSSALRRFHKEARPLNRVLIVVRRK